MAIVGVSFVNVFSQNLKGKKWIWQSLLNPVLLRSSLDEYISIYGSGCWLEGTWSHCTGWRISLDVESQVLGLKSTIWFGELQIQPTTRDGKRRINQTIPQPRSNKQVLQPGRMENPRTGSKTAFGNLNHIEVTITFVPLLDTCLIFCQFLKTSSSGQTSLKFSRFASCKNCRFCKVKEKPLK